MGNTEKINNTETKKASREIVQEKEIKTELERVKKEIEIFHGKMEKYNWFFKLKIPNEKQGAIEYDLEEICMHQGCTVEEVLELNNITIDKLKPEKIIFVPIISWKNDEERLVHLEEKWPIKKVQWWELKPAEEAQRLWTNIAEKHYYDTSLIFDKKDSRMYILKEWQIIYSTVFLSGRNNTTDIMSFPGMTEDFNEDTNPDFMITPGWKFPVSLNADGDGDYKTSFDYLGWSFANWALHAPNKKKHSMNIARMNTPEVTDNNTTWGCMVMTPEALEIIKKYYQDKKTYAYVIPLHGKLEDYIPIH